MKKTETVKEQIGAVELASELKPLLDDYFIGNIRRNGKHITYILPNGQKFIIFVQKVS